MLNEILKQIILEKQKLGMRKALIINFLKEYLQYLILDLLYNHRLYKTLVFKGESCLRICWGLPRLSEDLDFDGKSRGVEFLTGLEDFLKKELLAKYSVTIL